MSWWQIVLSILGLCIGGLLLGLAVGYVVLRVQKRPWPFAWPRLGQPKEMVFEDESMVPQAKVPDFPLEEKRKSDELTSPRPEPFSRRSGPPVTEVAKPAKSELVKEIESNLAIATAPWAGKMSSFQTKVLDTNRGKIDAVLPELQEDLTEAYTDMHLANTLAWLSTDVGHHSKDMDESYLKLCNKIAERLQKIKPSLARSGI